MPCKKCSNGKWRLGSGKCMYTTLENCKKAEAAYYANKDKELEKDDSERKSGNNNKKNV